MNFTERIPPIFRPLPYPKRLLQQKLLEEARGHFFHRQSKDTLSEEELRNLWFILEELSTSTSNGDQMVSYDKFRAMKYNLSSKFK